MVCNMHDKISVIVPAFNVEKYLNRCVESILNQTYSNIEVILIDDGSTDSSGKICDELGIKDSRIKVIHKKNGGLSDARNCGLDEATGKYVCFIDSDDSIKNNYIEKLYEAIVKNDVQIAVCGYNRIDENDNFLENTILSDEVLSGHQILLDFYDKKYYPASVVQWNKLYEIKLFKNIRFPVGKINEDEYTTFKLFYGTPKVALISDSLYNYRFVSTSITKKKFNIKRLDIIGAIEERINFFEKNNENEIVEKSLVIYGNILLDSYVNTKKYIENSKTIQKELRIKFKKNYRRIVKTKECSFSNKIKFTIYYAFPFLYEKVFNLKRRNEK